jgi:hypothetical protein
VRTPVVIYRCTAEDFGLDAGQLRERFAFYRP